MHVIQSLRIDMQPLRLISGWMRSTEASTSNAPMTCQRIRIAVVGDVHDQWNNQDDKRALEKLKPDLVLFTGDFGDENVELVQSISKLDFLKAVILGNHDCWYSAGFFARESDAVEAQLQSLKGSHVGYKCMDIPELKLSIIGSRPFSSGGEKIGYASQIISERFGIKGMSHSAGKISSLALKAPTEHVLVFLGHNGPTGLGSQPFDICGKDWDPRSSGDHGDPDLEEALKAVKEKGLHNVQLVVFGHMHKALQWGRGNRTMLVRGQDGIIYVNAAVVPRVIAVRAGNDMEPESLRNFTTIDLVGGQVEKVAETWVRVGEHVSVERETVLYSSLEQGAVA